MTTGQSSSEKYNCEKCHDSGFILYEKYIGGLPYTFAEECPFCNGGAAKVERRKEQADIPSELYDVTIDDFDWSVYKTDDFKIIDTSGKQQIVTLFVNEFPEWSKRGRGLYIWSKTRGSGKTYLASAIVNTIMKKYTAKARFVSSADLIRIDKEQEFDPYADRYTTNGIDKLLKCDLLVIDDIGATNSGAGWTEDILFRLIDKRMGEKKSIIFTSNLALDDLPLGARIADRINKMTSNIALPEVKVRSKQAAEEEREFLESLGVKF